MFFWFRLVALALTPQGRAWEGLVVEGVQIRRFLVWTFLSPIRVQPGFGLVSATSSLDRMFGEPDEGFVWSEDLRLSYYC